MRHASSVVLILALAGSALSAQTPPPKPPVAKKPVAPASRDLGHKLVDTALTAAASAVADSLLGKNAAAVAGVMAMMGANGMPTCAAGLIPYPSPAMAAAGNAATAAAVAAVAAATGTTPPTAGAMAGLIPGASAGTAIVDAAKKKLVKAPAVVPGAPQFLCGTPAQATVAMQSMVAGAQAMQAAQVAGMTPAAQAQLAQLGQATQLAQVAQAAQAGQVAQAGRAAQIAQAAQAVTGAAGGQAGMPSVGSMLAATPQGMMVNAAAPLAGAAAKKLSGMLKGSQSKESMAADLAKGKLILKGVKFVEGTDMFASEPEGEIAALVEAIKAVDGQFILNVPAESDGKSPPEVSMAQRRLGKITAMLVAGGITDDRITTRGVQPPGLDPKASAPKPGAGRPELIRVPKESKP